jgi:hypothetical protein
LEVNIASQLNNCGTGGVFGGVALPIARAMNIIRARWIKPSLHQVVNEIETFQMASMWFAQQRIANTSYELNIDGSFEITNVPNGVNVAGPQLPT